jgi:hypothetical protein
MILEVGKVNIQSSISCIVSFTREFARGGDSCGQLGLGAKISVAVPEEIPVFSGRRIVTVACNHAEHSLVLLRMFLYCFH